jgi:vacuolar iron transporter family protein
MPHRERHRSERIGWLRAAVLGANDGIVSTASLVVGVAAAEATRQDVLVAGVAGLVAGALSMAAGEYVSVSSQADTEKADLTRERHELATEPQAEEDELTGIYVRRGLEPDLARTVARQLTSKGALAAHARDELGLTEEFAARPLQAALASAATFAVGAGVPIVTDPPRTGDRARAGGLDCVVVVPGRTRRRRGTHRWRTHARRCGEGHHLGSLGHVGDGGRWKAVRHDSGLNGALRGLVSRRCVSRRPPELSLQLSL